MIVGWFVALRLWEHGVVWWAWLAVAATIALLRYVFSTHHFAKINRLNDNTRKLALIILAGLVGLQMMFLVLFAPISGPLEFGFLVLFLVPSTAGSAFALAASFTAFSLHTLPLLVALAYRLSGLPGTTAFFENDASALALWGPVTLYAAYVSLLALHMSQQVTSYVGLQQELLSTQEALKAEAREAEQQWEARQRADAAVHDANMVKSRLLANTSHEIRTPMNAVLGMAETLLWDEDDPEKRDKLELLIRSGNDLRQLLSDVIDMNQLDVGKVTLNEQHVDLRASLHSVIRLHQQLAEDKGLTFKATVDAETPRQVTVDPVRLRQVLANLLSNAIKYTDEGHVALDVGVREKRTDACSLFIRVSDTGCGISDVDQKTIFDPFDRSENTYAQARPGAGLGLSITKSIAELMGGELSVESEEDKGSIFTFAFDVTRFDDEETAQQTSSVPDEDDFELISGLKVLLAEDNIGNQRVAKAYLAAVSIDPIIVNDGQAALELAEREVFDVIILDVHMPTMDGFTTLEHLREGRSMNQNTPVLMMSANLDPEAVRRSQSLGAVGYLGKPLPPSDLFQGLQEAVRSSAAQSQSVG